MSVEASLFRDSLGVVLARDLRSLDAQIAAYPDDDSLWKTAAGISNPAGNLALHIAGNLRHFVGATLGGTGYVRNRDAEFGTRGLSRDEVRLEIRAAISDVERTVSRISVEQLAGRYPLPVPDREVRTAEFLMHLAVHLTYHLGQVDYHRRILTENPAAVANVSIRDIPDAPVR